MVLHGIDVPSQIRRDNTLARPLRDYGPKDRVQVVITNPPFGGVEEPGIENNFPQVFRTRETADLFLLLILTVLEDGGRAALVLPDGTLFGEGVKTRLKERLLEECDLHTIVRLPKGVFNPYTSIKTNLLFFTKGKPTKEVWFYEHPYPAGYKSYSKTKPLRFEEFEPERKWWNKRTENERAWKVSVEDIKARGFNLDIKNPRAVDEGPGDADDLLEQYQELALTVTQAREALRNELNAALKGKAWQRVADNFEVLFSKAESIGALRKAILELAIRGKLAPQAVEDEPVHVLLSSLKTTKAAHIPKRKKAQLQYDEELQVVPPFELPTTWQWARLEELTSKVEYGTSSKPIDDSRGVALLRMSNLQGGRLIFNSLKYVSRDIEGIETLMLEPGDILFNRTNSYELVGKTAVFLDQPSTYTFASYLIRASVLTGVESARFLNFYFCTPTFRATQLEPGIVQQNGQANFNGSKFRSVWVPVPPLAEQKRIVAKVDQLMALCDTLESKLRDAEQGAQRLAEAMAAEMVA